MSDVWLINGLPGAGKTTVGRMLAAKLGRAAHIEGDALRRFIVGENRRPDDKADPLAELNIRNEALLAQSFSEAGFVPVLDHLVETRELLDQYRRTLEGLDLHFVMLVPERNVIEQRDRDRAAVHGHTHEEMFYLAETFLIEFRGIGLWLDSSALTPEETVDEVLARRSQARL